MYTYLVPGLKHKFKVGLYQSGLEFSLSLLSRLLRAWSEEGLVRKKGGEEISE